MSTSSEMEAAPIRTYKWGKRYLVAAYVFAPGGNERTGQHEHGEGLLAEYDLFGPRRTVAGVNLLRGTAGLRDRMLYGPYARFGFGKWGFLAEHDITERTVKTGTPVSLQESTSYGQLFWAAREWMMPSLIVERLRVDKPYQEQLDAIGLDFAVRISSQFTFSLGPRVQRDELTGRYAKSLVFQIAVKTVH